jgi:phytochrome-interacting factor 3
LFELVLENGQISVQGQSSSISNIGKKSSTCKSFPSHTIRGHGKDTGQHGNETNTRMKKFEDLDNGNLNEILTRHVSSNQDEDVMMPWLNYAMDEHSLQHDYNYSFLHELSGGVNTNDFAASNKFSLFDRRSNCIQVFSDSHKQGILYKGSSVAAATEEFETFGLKNSTNQLYAASQLHQCQPSHDNDSKSNANQHAPCEEISHIPSSSNIMNFTHFAKPVAVVKANLHNIGLTSSRSEISGIKNKDEAAIGISPLESTKVYLSGDCLKNSVIHCHHAVEPSRVDLKSMEPKSLEQNAAVSTPACKDVSKFDQTSNQVLGESGRKGQEGVEKCMEQTVVSSSVCCSDNGAYRGSDDANQNLKRKNLDSEDSEWNSEVSILELSCPVS